MFPTRAENHYAPTGKALITETANTLVNLAGNAKKALRLVDREVVGKYQEAVRAELLARIYPLGTQFTNDEPEMDDDDGTERITPIGSVWTVMYVDVEGIRHLGCEVSGASIAPDIEQLDKTFTLVAKA